MIKAKSFRQIIRTRTLKKNPATRVLLHCTFEIKRDLPRYRAGLLPPLPFNYGENISPGAAVLLDPSLQLRAWQLAANATVCGVGTTTPRPLTARFIRKAKRKGK